MLQLGSALLLFFLSACSGVTNSELGTIVGVSTTSSPVVTSTPAGISMNIVGGSNQSGAPGSTFSDALRVQLLNNGAPMSGRSVNFTVVTGTGLSFSASSGTTDSSGMVQTFVTAGPTAGNVLIRASYLAYTADFSLSIINQTNATLTRISGDAQSAPVGTVLAQPLVVETRDSVTTLPLSNILVRFTVSAGNGRLNSSSSTITVSSDGTGRATANFEVGTLAGSNTVVASIVSVPAQSTTFNSTGTVPTTSPVSLAQSNVTAATSSLVADGSQTTTLTLTTRDVYGNIIPTGGKTVTFTVNTGTLVGSVNDVGNGTYTQIVRAPASMPPNSILAGGTVGGQALTSANATINLISGSVSLTNSTITSSSASILADGVSTTLITVTLRDSLGNQLTTGGQSVVISTSRGTLIGSVTDVGNGTYTQTLRSSTSSGNAIVSATVGGSPISGSGMVAFTAGPPDPTKSVIVATPSTLPPNGTSASIVTVQLRDANDNPASSSTGRTVTLTKTSGTWIGSGTNTVTCTDNNDGTYSAILIAPGTPGSSVITGTDNATILTKTATVFFTNGNLGPSATQSLIELVGSNPAPADNLSTVTVLITLRDSFQNPILTGGSTVVINTPAGTLLGTVTDNGNGTYSQLLRAPAAGAVATITASVDGNTLTRSVTQRFYGTISLSQSTLTASPGSILANGTASTVIYLNAKDSNGTAIPVGGQTGITFGTTAGTLLGTIQDNANGTYSQILQSAASAQTATVSAQQSAIAFSNTVAVEFFAPSNLAGVTITCANIATYKNTTLYVDNGTLTMNTNSAAGYCPNDFVFNGIVLQNNAVLTHSATTWTQEFWLELTAGYITIDSTSRIDVTAKGYHNTELISGGPYFTNKSRTQGNTNSTSSNCSSGGSYGGGGSGLTVARTYGSIFEPFDLGSSGFHCNGYPGSGGGKVKLTITGSAGLSNSGAIVANGGKVGGDVYISGGGSGGSVWINTTKISGSGTIAANGEGITAQTGIPVARGGGGRVAIYYGAFADASGNFSYPTGILNNVSAQGGVGGGCAGGAGTVYLKSTSQTYGDLIISNKGVNTCADTPGTVIQTASVPANESITSNSLTRTNAFADLNPAISPFVGWYLDPKPAQNSTPKKADNSLYKITAATSSTLTTSGGNMLSVATVADPAELVLVFDNLEIGDKTIVSFGSVPVLVYQGDLRSNDNVSVALIDATLPAGVEFNGIQNLSLNLATRTQPTLVNTDYAGAAVSLINGTFNFGTLKASSLTATSMTMAGNKIETTGGITLAGSNVTLTQPKGSWAIQAGGALEISSSSNLFQGATTTTVENSLEIQAASVNVSTGSKINSTGRGYVQLATWYYTVPGFQSVLAFNGSGNTAAGGSHGGRGGNAGSNTYWPSEVFDNFKNPNYSGGSGGWNESLPGGGIVRITTTSSGPITINGIIEARGAGSATNSKAAGAGGTVYLNGGLLTGTGSIDVRGGDAAGWAGGGGGRAAVYYTSLGGNFTYPTNATNNIKAWGGTGTYNTTEGAAGTVFMKASSETYGKLIINNNNMSIPQSWPQKTVIELPVQSSNSGLTYNAGQNETTLVSVGSFTEKYGDFDAFVGMYLHPNTAQNSTVSIADDTLFEIKGQTANSLILHGNATTVATNGDVFRMHIRLDDLRVVNKALLEINNGVILTNNLDVSDSQIFGTGGVEIVPSTSTIINAGGGTVNLNSITASAPITIQNGTFIFPTGASITTTSGGISVTSAPLTGTGLVFNAAGALSFTSSPFNATSLTAGAGLTLTSTTGVIADNITVTGDTTIQTNSNLNQTPGKSLSTTGNLNITSSSSVSASTITVGGNLLADIGSTLTTGNQVATPFTTYNTVSNVNVTGNFTVTNSSTVTTFDTTGTHEYYLFATAANMTIDGTSVVHADAKGYRNTVAYVYQGPGNTTVNCYNEAGVQSGSCAGAGAHGGRGGSAQWNTYWPTNSYDSWAEPIMLGSSGSCWGPVGCNDDGGGAIRLAISGTLTLNGQIRANGSLGAYSGGAGGSVLVNTGTLAGAGTIAAHGGPSGGHGSGGGGRIAVYFTSATGTLSSGVSRMANFKAYSGTGGNLDVQGSAGTVYVKAASQTYGDFMVDNNNQNSNYMTRIFNASVASSSVVTATTLTAGGAFSNVFGNIPNFFKGYYLNPDTTQNATKILSDDAVFKVTSSTSNELNVSTGDMTSIAAGGDPFSALLIFDNFEVRALGKVNFSSSNIRVISGDITSNDTNNFVLDGGLTANIVDLGPSTTWTNTGNASGTLTVPPCASNYPCP